MREIINSMLERKADEAALDWLVSPFHDLERSHWAYRELMEAAIPHAFSWDDETGEGWTHW